MRRGLSNALALTAGWIVVLFYLQHQPIVIIDHVAMVAPFNPFVFLSGAMFGITLVTLENTIPEWWRTRKEAKAC